MFLDAYMIFTLVGFFFSGLGGKLRFSSGFPNYWALSFGFSICLLMLISFFSLIYEKESPTARSGPLYELAFAFCPSAEELPSSRSMGDLFADDMNFLKGLEYWLLSPGLFGTPFGPFMLGSLLNTWTGIYSCSSCVFKYSIARSCGDTGIPISTGTSAAGSLVLCEAGSKTGAYRLPRLRGCCWERT